MSRSGSTVWQVVRKRATRVAGAVLGAVALAGVLALGGSPTAVVLAQSAAVCDVNNDGAVDTADLNLIRAKNNQKASGPTDPFDPNRDGKVDVADLRYCQLRLTPPNQAPTVTAGGNQTIALPSGATLTGAVADDGLPLGATLTRQWTQQSGPGTTTFADATSAATTATFSVAGTYVLRLTASDTSKTAFAETTITVNAAPPPPPVNQAPQVTSGGNQTITLPSGATLNGTVTDDGLPSGATVTSQWTQQSGPGTTTFANAASAATTATFSAAGTYVLRLTASDTALSAFAETTVTVNAAPPPPPVNQAPIVTAGPTQTITLPADATLFGSVTDDGLPQGAAVTTAWSKQSGPGTATFAKATSPSTTVTFSAAGTYVLRLTASDTNSSAFADTTIVVNPVAVVNQPPIVTAGANQTVSLPAGAALTGVVTDDNQPQGASVTSQWTQQSGPGTTTFVNAASAATTATFSVAGTYVLRLTADDTALSAFAETTITVNPLPPTNQAPQVTAGADQTVILPALATLSGAVTDDGLPQGSSVTSQWSQVSGPGSATFTDATAPVTAASFSLAGDYVLKLAATDTDTLAFATVQIHASAPVITNRAPSVDAGPDVQVVLGTSAPLQGSATDDGQPTPQVHAQWLKLSGPGTVTFGSQTSTVTNADFSAAGVYVLTLTASDSLLSASDDVAVTVTPPAGPSDRSPPLVTVMAPTAALPGATIEVTVSATDDLGVASVSIDVDGDTPETLSLPPFTRSVVVPQFAAPGRALTLHAVARDAAQNAGTASATVVIGTVPDTDNPTVQLFGPTATAPGASIELVAAASDAVGVQSVSFLVNGVQVTTDDSQPYSTTYTVPAAATVGTPLEVVAHAVDFAGNAADSAIQIEVRAAVQTTLPSVTLTLPAEALPGEVITLSADATDAAGVASVAFTQDAAVIGTDLTSPYSVAYTVPLLAAPGSTIAFTANATNFAAQTGSDTKSLIVKATPQITLGVITGEVYDDTTSLPLADASITLIGIDGQGAPYTQVATSDARGRFLLRANAGHGVVTITRDMWNRVDRPLAIVGGQAVELLDARLTPLALVQTIGSASGATLTVAGGSVTLAPGALTQGGPIRFATPTQQGLEGRPPFGWSPVGAADIWPHGTAFGSPAALRVRKLASVTAAQPIVLATWDEAVAGWRAIGAASLSADGTSVQGSVDASGQFVFFVADVAPQAPPAPAVGALLQGVADAALPGGRSTTILPRPQVLFYQPGVRSDVHSAVTTGAPGTSGTLLTSRVTETYIFVSGAEARPQPFVEDLLFFQAPAAIDTLTADISVTPSLAFESATLSNGTITIELFEGQPGATTPLLDSNGGEAQGPGGELLMLPPAALSNVTPITLRTIDTSNFGLSLPAGLSLVGGVDVSVPAGLARTAALSIARPPTLTDDSGVVLVRLDQIQGRTRMVLVGVGRIAGDRLVSDTLIGGQQTVLEGVRLDGQYAFLQSASALGFAGGPVLGTTRAPLAGALVASDTFPVVSLSTGAGAYLAAAPVGTTLLTATDLQKNDSGATPAYLAAGTVTSATLQLVAQAPRITRITPADGSTNVPLSGTVSVTFSEPIDPATLTIASMTMSGPNGAVDGVRALSQGNSMLTFRPVATLDPNAKYTVQLTEAITDVSGYALATPVSVSFDSLDTRPPPPPPAGAITASIPDTHGLTSVSATQGTAALTDKVFVDNLTSGGVAVALVQANGSFSTSIAAEARDTLRVRIVDVAGNETTVDLDAFKQTNPDGSVSQFVSAGGGIVDGPDGIRAEVPAGAFDQGAVVTIASVPLAAFPVTMTPAQAANFPLVQAVRLDFGGAEATRPLRLSVAAQPGDTADDQWLVMQVVDLNGRKYLDVADTAHFDNGRIVDPPVYCPGVLAAAVYGISKAAQTFGLNYAQMYSSGRYQLQAQTQSFRAGLPFDVPFTTFNAVLPVPVCFPVITGRVTVSPNTMNFEIPSDEAYLADDQILVRNVTRGTQKSISRSVDRSQFSFDITGTAFDSYRVEDRSGATPVSIPYDLAPGPSAQTVTVTPQLERIAASVHQFVVINLTRNISKTFKVPIFNFTASAPGSLSDTFELTGVPSAISKGAPHVLKGFASRPSTPGTGNLVVRAQAGTIDPTRAEADAAGQGGGGAARTVCPPGQTVPDAAAPCGVTITSASGKVALVIPDVVINQGGFEFAFDGDTDDVFTLTINYDTRAPFSVELPRFSLNIINTITGAIIDTITGQAPPKDAPLSLTDLIGRITDDLTAPFLVDGPTVVSDLGAGAAIGFTFSKAMDAASLKANVVVTDSSGNQVDGEIRVSNDNRTVTFVPTVTDAVTGLIQGGLQLGQTYILTVKGTLQGLGTVNAGICQAVCDLAGNVFQGIVSMPVSTFGPHLLQHLPLGEPAKDVQMVRREVTDGAGNKTQETDLFVTAGSQHLLTFDVTDVSVAPVRLSSTNSDSVGIQRLSLLPNVNLQTALFASPVRDLAVATAFNASTGGGNASFLNFFDVTDPASPIALGREALTSDPDPEFGVREPGAAPGTGFAKGVTTFVAPDGSAVSFAAVERMGLFGLDLNSRFRPVLGGLGRGHIKNGGSTSLGGDFTDVAPYGCSSDAKLVGQCDKAVAIHRTRDRVQDLVVIGADMSVLGQMALPSNAKRLRVAERIPVDSNGDGKILQSELLDLAFVGGDNGITIVLLGRGNSHVGSSAEVLPRVYGQVPIKGVVTDLEVAGPEFQVVAVFDSAYTGTSGPFIATIDVSQPATSVLVDRNNDDVDDRIIYRAPFPSGVNSMKLDADRQLLYLATPAGLDIYKVGNLCCDLKVDMQQKQLTTAQPTGGTKELLAREKKALKTGIVKGLARAAQMCQGFDPAQMKIWESGSSACLWTEKPDEACGSNYQPGVSDHDLSTFMPDAWYLSQVNNPDKTTDPKDKRKAQVPLASCVVQSLTYPFTNPNIGDPELSPRAPDDPEGVGFRFADISFLPNYTADLTSMRYRLARTMPGIPGDSDNTLGLGMQGLILKHLTEAYGIELSGVQDPAIGYQPAFEQVGVSKEEIAGYLKIYRTNAAVKIPTVEGYEWANLMEYQLRKAYTAVRIRGAADASSQFHDLFVSQVHLAGKAGIRAALGRLSAVPATRDMVLNFRRDSSDTDEGPFPGQVPLTLRGAGADACLKYDADQPDPTLWNTTDCTGMEHYVASVAVRALAIQSSLPPDQQMFTLADVRQVFDFYLVKADEKHIDTDQDADNFIASTFNFVLATKTLTEPEYHRWINDAAKTSANPIDALPDPDQQNGGANDPEGLTTTRGQRRVNNLARKEVRMVAKAKTHLHIVPHILNRGSRPQQDVKVGMYWTEPGGPQKQFTWTQVNTGTTLGFENLKKLSGGEHRYLEWQTDSDGSLSRDPGTDPNDEGVGKTVDLFELEVDQTTPNKNQAAYVAFTVDLPERHSKEANRRNNYDGFFYFVLDSSTCAPNAGPNAYGLTCQPPAGIAKKVPFPLSDPTLLAPDTECDLLPDVTITQTFEVDGQPVLSAPVSLETRQKAVVKITVTNDSDVDVKDLVVRTPFGNYTSAPTSIAAHGSSTFTTAPFTSASPAVLVSLPTVTSSSFGFQSGTPETLLFNVCGPGPYIVGLNPDVNPEGARSRVMRNGFAVRYYRAVDKNGVAAPNTELKLRVQGIPGKVFTFTSNANGDFVYQTTRTNAKGEDAAESAPGIAVPFEGYLGRDGAETRVLIDAINGITPPCTNRTLFTVYVDPLEFTYEFEAGGAVEAGLSVFGLANANASLGGAFTLRLFHRGDARKITEPGIYRLDWERKTAFGFQAKFGFDGFTAESEFDNKRANDGSLHLSGKSKAEAFKLGGNVAASATQAYRYTFSGPMSQWTKMQKDGFSALLFPSVSESDERAILTWIGDPTGTGINLGSENMKLHRKVFSELFEPVLGSIDQYKIFRSARVATLSASGDVQAVPFSGTIDFDIQRAPNPNDPPNVPVVKDADGQVAGRASTAADKADTKDKEKSEPAFKADSSFKGKFHVTYEMVEQLKHELGDPARSNPSAVGERVVGAIHTLTFDTQYDYKAEFSTNLGFVKKEIDAPNVNYPQEPQFVKDNAKKALDWLEKRIAGADAASFDGGLQFRVFSKLDANKVYKPWRLEVTFRGPKNFGIVGGQAKPGQGAQYGLTFAVEGETQTNAVIAEAFQQAAAFRVLLTQTEEQNMKAFVGALAAGHLPAEVDHVSPSELYLWFLKFVKAVLIYGGRPTGGAVNGNFSEATPSYPEFYEEVRKGTTESTDFGAAKNFPGKKIGVSLKPFTLDSSVRYRTSRGIVVRGQLVLLEDYGTLNMDASTPTQLIEAALQNNLKSAVDSVEQRVFGGTISNPFAAGDGGTQSTQLTSMLFGSAPDFQNTNVGRYDWRTSASLLPVTHYAPEDDTAPAHKPHYGLGGFRIVGSQRVEDFDVPATLTLSYDDAEVDGFAEASIRMFVWNAVKEDWVLVPAVLDTTANSVTATVPRGGLYTLGPIMPAGRLTWSITALNRLGSGPTATTTVSLESTATVTNNDGTPVAPGTVMHVRVVDGSGGTVLTPDVDPTLADTQVLVDPDGKVRLQFSIPGSPLAMGIEVFSHLGTADGTADITLP